MAVSDIAPIGARDETNISRYLPLPGETLSPKKAGAQLDDATKKEVAEMKKRDREVRQHEMAHLAAGGAYVRGGPTYGYKVGPDGQRYAVSGEVQIDTSEVPDDPEATLKKMQVVMKAALAPKDPSGQDYQVAAQARKLEMKARAEIAQQRNNPDDDATKAEKPLVGVNIQV